MIRVQIASGEVCLEQHNLEVGWLLENGGMGEHKKFIYIREDGICFDWTTDPYKAFRCARREDAEQMSRIIEDAWNLVLHGFDVAKNQRPDKAGGHVVVFREGDQIVKPENFHPCQLE